MTIPLRVGMGDRYGIHAVIEATEDFDPSLPTAAVLEVTKPEGQTVEWTAVILTQSADDIEIDYRFNADGTDLDQDGLWRVWVQWTEPGVTIGSRTEVGSFAVVAADFL